jgi:hypothetical protein
MEKPPSSFFLFDKDSRKHFKVFIAESHPSASMGSARPSLHTLLSGVIPPVPAKNARNPWKYFPS